MSNCMVRLAREKPAFASFRNVVECCQPTGLLGLAKGGLLSLPTPARLFFSNALVKSSLALTRATPLLQ